MNTQRKLPASTRADRLIAEAETDGKAHGQGWEAGVLRGTIRNLCSELDAYAPIRQATLNYAHLTLDRGLPVEVGYEFSGEDLDIVEVWCNGLDIVDHLKAAALEQLRQDAFALHPFEVPA